jgi:phytoene dehydrogenase-like protein
MTLRIAVIGGGIGGLTAAVALLQAGFEVEV